jgi:hypothetical protein
LSGCFTISRCLWDDAAFQDEPFSEREAWVWMIAEAKWKPQEKRVGSAVVQLDRGQLAHSTRFLSDAWKWSHSKVRRFLERLENRHMIQRATDTGLSVITICKYNEYQLSPDQSGTASARDAAQQRHSSGTNLNKGNKGNKGEEDRDTNVSLALSAPEPASPIAEAVRIYNEAAEVTGWPKVQKLSPARSQALKARLRDCGGIEGWRFAMDKGKASDFLCGKATGTTPACFDWITKAANFAKIMEGNYDNRDRPSPRNSIADTTAREITFAATAIRTPQRDCF